MIPFSFQPVGSHQRCLLMICLLGCLSGSTAEYVLATGLTQPRSDQDAPVPLSFDWQRPQHVVPPLAHDTERNMLRIAPFATPSALTTAQYEGTASKADGAAAGPVVIGRVIYRGSAPAPMQVEVTRDAEVCGRMITVASMTIDPTTRGVRDAIVHVESETEPVNGLPPHSSLVQNTHCRFHPRVVALRSGAQAEITNDDPVMHNTNITLENRTVLNVALVAGGNPIRKPLKRAGLHLVTCNVHKFMHAYRYVFSHPFFDQTNETGQFRLMALPPGRHTVSVWHETLGVLQKDIHVPAHGTVTVDFEFQ